MMTSSCCIILQWSQTKVLLLHITAVLCAVHTAWACIFFAAGITWSSDFFFFYASGVLFLYLQRLSQVCRSCCDECIGDTGGLTHRSSRLIINRNRFTRRSSRELRRTNINVLVYVLDTLFIWVSGCLRTIFISFFQSYINPPTNPYHLKSHIEAERGGGGYGTVVHYSLSSLWR